MEGDRYTGALLGHYRNFYPRSPGGGRPSPRPPAFVTVPISIHALRVEGDLCFLGCHQPFRVISIHALRVEGDRSRLFYSFQRLAFLSTPSGWRATIPRGMIGDQNKLFLSTPSGWRATACPRWQYVYARDISIHALRVEGDCGGNHAEMEGIIFLSTPSGWRATFCRRALRRVTCNFYPRPPGGGRHDARVSLPLKNAFLSTPSGWRATAGWKAPCPRFFGFLSTPSGWRATYVGSKMYTEGLISIHALRVEGDSSRIAGSTS